MTEFFKCPVCKHDTVEIGESGSCRFCSNYYKGKITFRQPKIWLVWVKKIHPTSGTPYMDIRSITTEAIMAELHRDALIRDEGDIQAVWVEERVANHCYGQREVGLAFRMSQVGNKWERTE